MNNILLISEIIGLVLLSLAVLFVFIRLLIGPTLPDRVVALDVLSMLMICFISIFVILTNHPIYLDIIIALALITFLGTIAFAQFIEYQLSHDEEGSLD